MPAVESTDAPQADERRMPFSEHLVELRTRLRNSVIAVLIGTIVAYAFRAPLFALLARPLIIAWAETPKEAGLPAPEIVFTGPAEGFMVLFKLALLAGIFLSCPWVFRELWKFISPGLYRRERRFALPFVIVSALLFTGGAAFAYLYVLPASYKYFLGYSTDSMGIIRDVFGRHEVWGYKIDIKLTEAFAIKPMITMDEYFGLTSMLLLLFGVVFELPLVLSVLAMIGIVSPRGLWRFNRYFILIAFIAGAVLTPGDLVVGQIAMGLSLTVLYNLSIVVALLVGRQRRKKAAEAEVVDAE